MSPDGKEWRADGGLPRERRLDIEAYFSFPLFRSAVRGESGWRLLIVATLMLSAALWPNGGIHPSVAMSFPGREADPMIASFIASFAANTAARLPAGSVFSVFGTLGVFPKIALLLGLVWWLPRLAFPRRPAVRLRLYLLHPETPAPFPTPGVNRSRYINVALRMTHPDMWRDFAAPATLSFRTDRYGRFPPPDKSRNLQALCLRLLRYAFLSRLPRLSQSTTVGEFKSATLNANASSPGTIAGATAAQTEPKRPIPAADPSPAEQADNAFRWAVYAHRFQLQLYLGLVLSALLYGLLFGFGATSKILAVILGLAWLSVSVDVLLKQVRAFSRWLHKHDNESWPPAYELDDERHWRYIWPDYFKQSSDAEVGIGHDRLLALAVTVLFALYLTLLQVIV